MHALSHPNTPLPIPCIPTSSKIIAMHSDKLWHKPGTCQLTRPTMFLVLALPILHYTDNITLTTVQVLSLKIKVSPMDVTPMDVAPLKSIQRMSLKKVQWIIHSYHCQ